MPKLRDTGDVTARIYSRTRGDAGPRYYGDFRDYRAVGGGQEPLVPEGARYATNCLDEAKRLVAGRLEELQELRSILPTGPAARRQLSALIPDHLERKAKLQEGGEQWLGNVQVHLETFEDYFGATRDLAAITLREMENYRAHLFELPNGRGGTLSSGSVAHYLNSISNLYDRAIRDNLVPHDGNLLRRLPELSIVRQETPFLEVPEMAAILRYAFVEYRPAREEIALPFFPVILALLALTGVREKEGLGLLISDVDLDRGIIHVRPNEFRPRLKTAKAQRPVPIFPQLADILRSYLGGLHAPSGKLLFPSPFSSEGEAMVKELRKAYDKMPMPKRLLRRRTPAELATAERERVRKLERALGKGPGPKPIETIAELQQPVALEIVTPLRSKILRHTYTAARLQSLDRGAPVANYTVAHELGHVSTQMVDKVYGHLGTFRYRGEGVEYRW